MKLYSVQIPIVKWKEHYKGRFSDILYYKLSILSQPVQLHQKLQEDSN